MQLSLTLKQTADILGCSKGTVLRWTKEGKIPAFITSKQMGYRVPFFALEAMGVPPSTLDRLITRSHKDRASSYISRGCTANLSPYMGKKSLLSALRSSHIKPFR